MDRKEHVVEQCYERRQSSTPRQRLSLSGSEASRRQGQAGAADQHERPERFESSLYFRTNSFPHGSTGSPSACGRVKIAKHVQPSRFSYTPCT